MHRIWRHPSRACITTNSMFLAHKACGSKPIIHLLSASSFATASRLRAVDFELLLPAVQAFQSRFGHFIVPYSFPIAQTDSEWPLETRGVDIGRRLHALLTNERHRKKNPDLLDHLGSIGFPVDDDWKRLLWKKRVFAALETYHSIHNHSIVPISFVVPSGNQDWPLETWNLDLGKRVAKLREHPDRLSDHELDDLKRIQFSFDVDTTHWQGTIRPAIQRFQQVYGHPFVKREFVVPRGSPSFPEEPTWGLKLGLVVHNIRCHGAYHDQLRHESNELLSGAWIHLIGSKEDEWTTVILPALQAFHTQYKHGDVPATFVVPQEDPLWPRQAWGFGLGQFAHCHQSLDLFRDQLSRDQEILHKLGAWWFASLDEKWDQQIFPALVQYVKSRRETSQDKQERDQENELMPVKFIVPSEAPWPCAAWGLKLGELVARMRTRNHFASQLERDPQMLQASGIAHVIG